jgi:hypothetical protein
MLLHVTHPIDCYIGMCGVFNCTTLEEQEAMEFCLSALYVNGLVVVRPKMSSQHKGNYEELVDVLTRNHGPSVSRNQGLKRAFHKTSAVETERILILFNNVKGGICQAEWQGENAKSDPFYVKTHHSVLKRLQIPQLLTTFQLAANEGARDIADGTSDRARRRGELDTIAEQLRNM